MLDCSCISDLCFGLKNTALKLTKHIDPVQHFGIRLLDLNDTYIFDRHIKSFVSKYFSTKDHTSLKPTLSFDAYLLPRELNCYDWCMDIDVSPPIGWISLLSLCAQLLAKVCEPKNLLDIHTAQILVQIFPALVNGPTDDSNKDSYIHYYLSPLLSSIFASESLLKMK